MDQGPIFLTRSMSGGLELSSLPPWLPHLHPPAHASGGLALGGLVPPVRLLCVPLLVLYFKLPRQDPGCVRSAQGSAAKGAKRGKEALDAGSAPLSRSVPPNPHLALALRSLASLPCCAPQQSVAGIPVDSIRDLGQGTDTARADGLATLPWRAGDMMLTLRMLGGQASLTLRASGESCRRGIYGLAPPGERKGGAGSWV